MKLIVKMRSFDEKVSKCKQVTSSPELSRSARAIVMRNYRARLKEDPLKYQLYCQSESHRSWIHRRQLTDEQKRKYTNKSKLRMRRLRERRKAEENANHNLAELGIETKSTQLKEEEQRRCRRMKTQVPRAGTSSSEEKRLVREKMLGSIADESSSSSEQEGSDSEDARAARRKATSMVKTVIPKLSADHYAKVVASLINTASPEQLTALRKHLVTI